MQILATIQINKFAFLPKRILKYIGASPFKLFSKLIELEDALETVQQRLHLRGGGGEGLCNGL